MANEVYQLEGFFETTLSSDLNSSDTTIPLTAVPSDVTEGYLIVEPNSSTKREVIHFTSVGGSSVTAADDPTDGSDASGRGCAGSITTGANTSHDQGVTVIIGAVKQYWDRYYTAVTDAQTGWIDANESWSYSSWDDTNGVSTAVITVPSGATTKYQAGMRVKFTQPTDGVKYGIITKVAATALTVFINTDYDFDNEAITSPYYSPMSTPFGFDRDPEKWMVETKSSTLYSQASPSGGTWYNLGSLSIDIPIGIWNVEYFVTVANDLGTGASRDLSDNNATLSTTTNSETDSDFTSRSSVLEADTTSQLYVSNELSRRKSLNLSSKDTYYLLEMTNEGSSDWLRIFNSNAPAIIRATCAYL